MTSAPTPTPDPNPQTALDTLADLCKETHEPAIRLQAAQAILHHVRNADTSFED